MINQLLHGYAPATGTGAPDNPPSGGRSGKPTHNGGPAFPPNAGWRDNDEECRGMSLRDFFAGQALTGMMQAGPENPDDLAKWAYEMADAMLAARRKGGAA